MIVKSVHDKKGMGDFVYFPGKLYAGNEYWAPPIWSEEKHAYRKENNAILINADFDLLVAYSDTGEPVGRCLIYIDHPFNKYYRTKNGFFGAFECADDPEAAEALMKTGAAWLADRGMNTMRGPIHPIAECWGFLLEGFDSIPVLMTPYNPPYYNRFMEDCGFTKVKDLLAYEADSRKGYTIPARIDSFAAKVLHRRPEITLRKIDRSSLIKEAEIIWEITNIAFKDNWGYVPVDRGVMEDMVKRLKIILDPDAVWFILVSGRPVGFALGFPDVNPTMKKIGGSLFPFGFLKLLTGVKRERRYRLLSLAVLQEYHGLGLDVLLYRQLYKALAPRGIVLEANYILEDNYNIRNALEKLDLDLVKKYRIYEKPL